MALQDRIDADRSWQDRTIPLRPAPPDRRRHSRSYSKFVRWAKLTLPAVAAGIVLLVALWPQIDSSTTPPSPKKLISDFIIGAEGSNRATDALFSSVDDKNRPVTVSADTIVQSGEIGTNYDQLEDLQFENPKATIRLDSGEVVQLSSPHGVYTHGSRILVLYGGVTLRQSEGYVIRTESTSVDLGTSKAWSHTRVTGSSPFGTVEAQGFEVLNEGSVIVFTGKPRLVLHPRRQPESRTR